MFRLKLYKYLSIFFVPVNNSSYFKSFYTRLTCTSYSMSSSCPFKLHCFDLSVAYFTLTLTHLIRKAAALLSDRFLASHAVFGHIVLSPMNMNTYSLLMNSSRWTNINQA